MFGDIVVNGYFPIFGDAREIALRRVDLPAFGKPTKPNIITID